MAALSSLFPTLPTLGVGSTSDSVLNYSVADSTKVINESYTSMNSTFGSAASTSFSKMTSDAPTFSSLGAVGSSGLTLPDNPYSSMASSEGAKLAATPSSFTATQVREAIGPEQTDDNSHIVKLRAKVADGASSSITDLGPLLAIEPLSEDEVLFEIMPQVSESYTANYEALSPSQMPGEFQKYKGSSSGQYNISNAKFTCRTREEARRNYIYLNTLRGWTKPYFGENQAIQFQGKLGAPPPVLELFGWRNLLGPISVVLTRLQWTWPDDVDWLPTGIFDKTSNKEVPFPSVLSVSIDLVESLSAEQFNSFNLVAFRRGFIEAAWNTTPPSTVSTRSGEPTGGQQQVTNGVVQPSGTSDTGDSQRAATATTTASATTPVSADAATAAPSNTDTPETSQPAVAPASDDKETLASISSKTSTRDSEQSIVNSITQARTNKLADIANQEALIQEALAQTPPDTATAQSLQFTVSDLKRDLSGIDENLSIHQAQVTTLNGQIDALNAKLGK
jgi:hypothetical protein